MYLISDRIDFKNKNNVKSDIIITCAILGFSLTRYYQNQPCQFDYEFPKKKDLIKWEKILSNKESVIKSEIIINIIRSISSRYACNKIKIEKYKDDIQKHESDDFQNQQENEKIKNELDKLENENRLTNLLENENSQREEYINLSNKIKKNLDKIDTEEKPKIDNSLLEEILKEINKSKVKNKLTYILEVIENLKIEYIPSNEETSIYQKITSKKPDLMSNETYNFESNTLIKNALSYCEYIKELDDQQNYFNILSTISHVMDHHEPGSGQHVLDGQSPFGQEGKLITGRKGSEGQDFKNRHGKMSLSKAHMLNNALKNKDSIYRGRGAYTGMVDDPRSDDTGLYPTERVAVNVGESKLIDRSNLEENIGDRYILGHEDEKDGLCYPWGLIGGLDNDLRSLSDNNEHTGMGPIRVLRDNSNSNSNIDGKEFKIVKNNTRIGYVHGMCTAIVKCKHAGPWSTPYEMATGSETTKMASCFACTTYMYANGYPPSSIHLGRGESWVPPHHSYTRLEEGKNTNTIEKRYSENCLFEWQREISAYIRLGLECIKNSNHTNFVNTKHMEDIDELHTKLAGNNDNEIVSDHFLEALTVHKKDSQRIQEVFSPLYEKYRILNQQSFT